MNGILELMLFQAVKFILRALLKSIDTPDLKSHVKQKVMDAIPGKRFDEAGWRAIEIIWDALTCEAEKQINDLGKGTVQSDIESVARSVAEAYNPLMKKIV